MAAAECVIHLLSLKVGVTSEDFLRDLANNSPGDEPPILKGRAHGWVHQPHNLDQEQLIAHEWHLFLLTHNGRLYDAAKDLLEAHFSVQVSIPRAQFDRLLAEIDTAPRPIPDTPTLPGEWVHAAGIPKSTISGPRASETLKAGELKLDNEMADFLTHALPTSVANAPVSLMNLFKYPSGDGSTHDAYMEGFKTKFGPAAGASVKFMGPVIGASKFESRNSSDTKNERQRWDDANLVQYDSIWHYAYMLSTDVYAQLNKQKIEGLEDTCILCVSEIELVK